MQKLVKEAKEFAGIKPDTIIDEEEKYYNRGAVEKYEAFLAGANCAYNEFINKACEYLKYNIYQFGTEQDKTWEEQIEIFVNRFKKAMEE